MLLHSSFVGTSLYTDDVFMTCIALDLEQVNLTCTLSLTTVFNLSYPYDHDLSRTPKPQVTLYDQMKAFFYIVNGNEAVMHEFPFMVSSRSIGSAGMRYLHDELQIYWVSGHGLSSC
jgi:hypothetical protein